MSNPLIPADAETIDGAPVAPWTVEEALGLDASVADLLAQKRRTDEVLFGDASYVLSRLINRGRLDLAEAALRIAREQNP